MKFANARSLGLAAIMLTARIGFAAEPREPTIPLVDIKMVVPTIEVELRYATEKNIAGRPLYPRNTHAVTRPEVANRLAVAQRILQRYRYSLKIWDAYRPRAVQEQLWEASKNNLYVADPNAGAGSLHGWGLAIDATLVDSWNRPVSMPTDFDDFTPAAFWKYTGRDPAIKSHLYLLQIAMRDAGFYGLRSEWWHFTVYNWQSFLPPEEAKAAMESMGILSKDGDSDKEKDKPKAKAKAETKAKPEKES